MKILQKYDFSNLDIIDQINYINKLLEEGSTLTKVCKDIGIARSTVSRRFKKVSYKFSKEKNKYICITKVIKDRTKNKLPQTDVIKNENCKENKNYKSNTKVIDEEQRKKIDDVFPILLEMVEWYKRNKENIDKKNLLKIDNEKFKGEIRSQSIKCYTEIYDRFNKFCDKHIEYKKQILVSLALLEFLERYED